MGKPDDVAALAAQPPPRDESSSAISLHTQGSPPTRYFDDEPPSPSNEDLPPLYTDHESDQPINPLLPDGATPLQVPYFLHETGGCADTEYYIDRRLDTDAVFLKEHIDRLALLPPRPLIRIQGHHKQSVRGKDGKSETKEVCDFAITLELTHLLYSDINSREPFLRQVTTAGNFEKVRRGTVYATRAPGYGGNGVAEEGVPDVGEWCQRFCSSKAGLKTFSFERQVQGYDFNMLQTKITSLIRGTNYRGRINVDFPVQNARCEIWNESRTNRWRLTKWIYMLFYFTLLFIFTWPYLFFRTKKWEVVTATWHMSKIEGGRKVYASMSEDRWYNTWARCISKAVLERRQGTLDQGDLMREDEPIREGLAGFVQQGVEAMGVVNRSFGWGGDC